MLLLGLKRLIERMTDQCWNEYMAGEMKHVDHCRLEPLLAFGSIFITFWIKIFNKFKFLPDFPERLLTITICPFWRSIIWGRIAFVREIVPTVFKSKIALSTSSEVFLIKPSCPLAPLLTKISTWKEMERAVGSYGKLLHIRTWLGLH